MQPDIAFLIRSSTNELATDGCSQMSTSMLPNVLPSLGSNATGTPPLYSGRPSLAHTPASPPERLYSFSRFSRNSGSTGIDTSQPAAGRNNVRHSYEAPATSNVGTSADLTLASRGPSVTLPTPAVAVGQAPRGRPIGPPAPQNPPWTGSLTRQHQHDQKPLQHQHQHRQSHQQPPRGLNAQQQQVLLKQVLPQPFRAGVSLDVLTALDGISGELASSGGSGRDDDVVVWEPLTQDDSWIAANFSNGHQVPSIGDAAATTAAVDAAAAGEYPERGGGGAAKPGTRTGAQVLLPPLLVCSPKGGEDSARRPAVFFGTGALPGLLVGSSPTGTGGGTGGVFSGVIAALGGPMFLHVAPTTTSRKHMNGMVPTAAVCLPNDSASLSLVGVISTNASVRSYGNQMPSGMAAVTLASHCTTAGANVLDLEDAALADLRHRQEAGPWVVWSGVPAATAAAGVMHGIAQRDVGGGGGVPCRGSDATASDFRNDWQQDPTSVSVADIRPFDTAAQLPLELTTGSTRPLEAQTHIGSFSPLRAIGALATAPASGVGTSGAAAAGTSAGADASAAAGALPPGPLSQEAASRTATGTGSDGAFRGPRGSRERGGSSGQAFVGGTGTGANDRPSLASTDAAAASQVPTSTAAGTPTTGSGGSLEPSAPASSPQPTSKAAIALHALVSKACDMPAATSLRMMGSHSNASRSTGARVGSPGANFGGCEAGSVPETPLARWQRAARAAGLTASIARGFRTLRNQHDENLVREEQLKVVGEIGAGSFARVDKCLYSPADGAKPFLVAVKRIKPEMLLSNRDPEDVQLFIQEAQLLRKLNHPHIVQYIGLGVLLGPHDNADADPMKELSSLPRSETEKRQRRRSSQQPEPPPRAYDKRHAAGFKHRIRSSEGEVAWPEEGQQQPAPPVPLLRGLFIVEEYLGGGTLKGAVYQQMLQPQQQLYTNVTALRWMAQVAGALSYMHTCRPKVLHRDIKLDNVLLLPGEESAFLDGCSAKLGDLGLAALLAHHRPPRTRWVVLGSRVGGRTRAGRAAEVLARTLANLTPCHVCCDVVAVLPSAEPHDMDHMDMDMEANAFVMRRQSEVSRVVRERVTAAAQAPPHLREADDAARLSKMLESHKRDRLGTYMYMAPEVYRRQKYDEKCDCFSFAMVLYEVFHRYIIACSLENTAQMEKYARQVSHGFRPAIHEDLPGPLRRVIQQCWATDPDVRPDMEAVAQELWAIDAKGLVAALDRKQQAGASGCCCVVS